MTIYHLEKNYYPEEDVCNYIRTQMNLNRLNSHLKYFDIKVVNGSNGISKQNKQLRVFDLGEAILLVQKRLYHATWSDNKRSRDSIPLITRILQFLKEVKEQEDGNNSE